jgi:HEAT repeat protein
MLSHSLALIALLGFVQDDAKQAEEDAKKKLEEFRATMKKAKTESDVVDAINSLGETQHPKILAELRSYLGRPSTEIRLAVAENLAKYKKSKEAGEAILKTALALGPKEKDVASKLVEFAADTEAKELAKQFTNLFRHKDVEIARAAVDGCGKVKSKDAIDPLIKLVMDLENVREDSGGAGSPPMPGPGTGGAAQEDEQVKRKRELLGPALSALRDITDEKWTKGKEWSDWWRKTKATFKEKE